MSTYFPATLPKEADPWLVRELQRIAQAMDDPTPVSAWDILYESPDKPRNGQMVVAGGNWNPGYGQGPYMYVNGQWTPMFGASVAEAAIIACSDETTALTTGLKRTFRLPYNVQIDEVICDVVTAPTGSSLIVDVDISGASILSTRPQIEAGEFSSLTGTAAVISTAAHSKGAKVEIYADQVGSTIAGTGLKVTFVWRKVS